VRAVSATAAKLAGLQIITPSGPCDHAKAAIDAYSEGAYAIQGGAVFRTAASPARREDQRRRSKFPADRFDRAKPRAPANDAIIA
jgi:hypothetical protein